MQDPILKKIFAIPTMVELLVRRYRSDLAPTIDFSTIRELPNELLSEQLDKRFPDMLFIADCPGDCRKVLLHIEFQATSDAEMALRKLDTLMRALEPGTDSKFRERIAAQLRPVLASVYDHTLLKETSLMATMLEVFTEARDADRASARNEGRLEGQARVIMRQAKQRFGPETARNIERLLAGVTDTDRMDRVAEAVIDCGGGGELLALVAGLVRAGQS